MSETQSRFVRHDMVAQMIANWWDQCNTHAPDPDVKLTSTELEILNLVAIGMTAVAIGHVRGTSPRSIRKQLETIYTKFGLRDRRQAVCYARSIGLIPAAPDTNSGAPHHSPDGAQAVLWIEPTRGQPRPPPEPEASWIRALPEAAASSAFVRSAQQLFDY